MVFLFRAEISVFIKLSVSERSVLGVFEWSYGAGSYPAGLHSRSLDRSPSFTAQGLFFHNALSPFGFTILTTGYLWVSREERRWWVRIGFVRDDRGH